jgi:hypothetical protein
LRRSLRDGSTRRALRLEISAVALAQLYDLRDRTNRIMTSRPLNSLSTRWHMHVDDRRNQIRLTRLNEITCQNASTTFLSLDSFLVHSLKSKARIAECAFRDPPKYRLEL